MSKRAWAGWFLLLVVMAAVWAAQAAQKRSSRRVLKLEELAYSDIDRLDRATTVFLLTFGNLEEHGPHLPIGSDYFQALGVRERVVERLRAAHPERTFVLVPIVPLGEGGANDLALDFDHVGTFAVRFETLRAVAADLGSTIARKGFKTIFLLHNHGTPLHNVAFSQAADFVSQRYAARMVNLTSLMFAEGFYSDAVLEKHLGKEGRARVGQTGHAGTAETSANLYLRGELVKPDYKKLPLFYLAELADIFRLAGRRDWLGYWSDPSVATAAIGRDLIADFVERTVRLAERALAGEDLSQAPRYPENLPPLPEAEAYIEQVQARYARQAAELDAWLAKQGR